MYTVCEQHLPNIVGVTPGPPPSYTTYWQPTTGIRPIYGLQSNEMSDLATGTTPPPSYEEAVAKYIAPSP